MSNSLDKSEKANLVNLLKKQMGYKDLEAPSCKTCLFSLKKANGYYCNFNRSTEFKVSVNGICNEFSTQSGSKSNEPSNFVQDPNTGDELPDIGGIPLVDLTNSPGIQQLNS